MSSTEKMTRREKISIYLPLAISTLVTFACLYVTIASQRADAKENEITQKVDKTTYDRDKTQTYDYIDKQDNQLRTEIKTHQEEDRQREEITQKWMQSIDAKLNILITKK